LPWPSHAPAADAHDGGRGRSVVGSVCHTRVGTPVARSVVDLLTSDAITELREGALQDKAG
jgi:hypothetical protein